MFAMQYSHRLPADYDMQRIRERAAQRGPLWDATEGLAFKAFVSRTRGRDGATDNLYASVYLWLDPASAAAFVMDERFQAVIDSFGRPRVETWLPLDARSGKQQQAVSLYREEILIEPAADLIAVRAAEIERNRHVARRPDTVAVWTALDPEAWRLVRFTLSADAPDPARGSTVYEVLHLAKPGLGRLP
ncbi:DUF4865 family protein [Undibacterium sp.]|jgi:hypothetical protein|uniref:DUF4865 family protein n=1 Tax=Undibacterium sp. TaxID=1914977 RepID=UPI002C46C06D|nr:DUF4865 family protein [Undibacterium sp.]HTD05551.1 DUF4865 family protein [Undibacterium sp.]